MATYSSSMRLELPIALPRLTPRRDLSRSAPSPLSASASRVATTANWPARSIRRISLGDSPSRAGSKSTSAAIRQRNGAASNSVMGRVAVRPAVSISQNALAPMPPGATTPRPVITARRARLVTGTRIHDHRLEEVSEPARDDVGRPGARMAGYPGHVPVGADDEQHVLRTVPDHDDGLLA